jgi:hypothetical protein
MFFVNGLRDLSSFIRARFQETPNGDLWAEIATIALMEMRAVGLAISYWQYDLRRGELQVLTDNTASLFALRKGYSRSWVMNEELIHISEILARQGLSIVVDFIPSKANPADDPSRGVYTIDDTKLVEARRIAAKAREERQRTSPRNLGRVLEKSTALKP